MNSNDGVPASDYMAYEDLRKPSHQLLIIGNGFDLACGLHSSYADFFGDLRAEVYQRQFDGMSWGEYLKSRDLTVWDVIFCGLRSDSRWFDVEADIDRWVNTSRDDGNDLIQNVLDALAEITDARITESPFIHSHDYLRCIGKPHSSSPATDVALYILDTLQRPDGDSFTRADVFEFFLAELHLLEERFSRYLERQLQVDHAYKQKALELLDALREDGLDPEHCRYDTTILSFNYTTPYSPKFDQTKDGMVSIHGRIGGETIFGIDGKDCMESDETLPFTKTYRIMGASRDGIRRMAHSPNSDLGPRTSTIKFFGHSLNDADYSYFQAIFDIVNLYDGDTKLVFYYRPHGPQTDERARDAAERNAMMKKVTRLLVAYGNTLDNPDHGKNLIHRLLLEGRLVVKKI